MSSFGNFLQIKTQILLHIWNLLVKTRRSVGGTSPEEVGRALTRRHAPPRALSTTAREGHAPDLKPNRFADVSLTQSHDRLGQTGSAHFRFRPGQTGSSYQMLTSSLTQAEPDPDFDPTMSTADPNFLTQPGQRSTRILTRPCQH